MLAIKHVDFRTNAEGREILTRLDGKSRTGEEPPVLVALVIIHMDAIAMHVAPKVMTGSMQDLFPVSGALQHRTGRAIHLPTS